MKRRVVFVGGPLCGKAEKLPEDDVCDYLTFDRAGRVYAYQHMLRPITAGTLRVQHRYVFCGHKPKLPKWLKKEIANRIEERDGDGQ